MAISGRGFLLLMQVFLCVAPAAAQGNGGNESSMLPRQYTVVRTTEKIVVDGKDLEPAWVKATETEPFIDIEGKKENAAPWSTTCKMLWDDEYLYVFTRFDERDIWASRKMHDERVYFDNAFEIFIDPDGDTHNYMEIQINALETVWDLFLTRPHRDGGSGLSGWDVRGLKKAVHVDGTLNKPGDTDRYWSIELAIPFRALSYGRNSLPKAGDIWKMNFSRVQWKFDVTDGIYDRKKDSSGKVERESYFVWSPQGLVNLHYPEKWGYVRFAEGPDNGGGFLDPADEQVKAALWKYYYLQQDYKRTEGKYATGLGELQKHFPAVTLPEIHGVSISGSQMQFIIQASAASGNIISLDHEGRQAVIKPGSTLQGQTAKQRTTNK